MLSVIHILPCHQRHTISAAERLRTALIIKSIFFPLCLLFYSIKEHKSRWSAVVIFVAVICFRMHWSHSPPWQMTHYSAVPVEAGDLGR